VILWNLAVQRVLPGSSTAGRCPDENVCGNTTASSGNKGILSANSQNVVSKCNASGAPSSTSCAAEKTSAGSTSNADQQDEMSVFYVDVLFLFEICCHWIFVTLKNITLLIG